MQMIVLGMHRSGTSMLCRLVNLMGAYFGPEGVSTGANRENAKGFWERRDVRALNDLLLHSAGCDWNRVLAFAPEAVSASALEEFNEGASRLILEMDAHRPWLMKEPRLCLLLGFWMKWLEVPVCVHILRDPVEVASSLRVRNQMPIEAGLALWERYVRSAFAASDGLPAVTVLHRDLMSAPVDATSRLCARLSELGVQGLRQPGEQEVLAFVREDLYRERSSSDELQAYADSPQSRLYRKMEENGGVAQVLQASEPGDVAPLAAYESGLEPPSPPRKESKVSEMERVLREKLSLKDEQIKVAKERGSRFESDLRHRNARVSALEQDLGSAREATARMKSQADRIPSLERELASLKDAAAVAKERLSRIPALEQSLSDAKRAQDAASEGLSRLRQSLEGAEQTASDATAELELLRQAKSDIDAVASGRLQDLARLTRMLLQRDRQLSELSRTTEATLDGLRNQHVADALDVQRIRLDRAAKVQAADEARLAAETQRAQLQQQLASLYASRTWKMGHPLRACGRLARRMLGRAPQTDLELIKASDLFDASWYLHAYADVAASGGDPGEHYLDFGNADGRNPGPGFDTRRYLQLNADVAASGMNALVHYLRHGRQAGRQT